MNDWEVVKERNKDRLAKLNLPRFSAPCKAMIFDEHCPYSLDIAPVKQVINTKDFSIHGQWCAQVIMLINPDVEFYGSGYIADVEKVIDFCIENNIRVISASMTFAKTARKEAALKKYYDWGGVFVAAAGNTPRQPVRYPAKSPYTICVSATNSPDNDGQEIDVTADSYWTVRNLRQGMFASFNGTSCSVPVIAGCITYILAAHPEWHCEDVRKFLRENSTPLAEEYERFFSFPDGFGKEVDGLNAIKPQWNWRYALTPLDINKVDGIALHHMAHSTAGYMDVDKWHKDNGWNGFGYNWWVSKSGEIVEGRGFNVGAGVEGHNSHLISIGFQGHFDVEQMGEAQIKAGQKLLRWLISQLPNLQVIAGHRYWTPTTCPGQFFPEKIFNKEVIDLFKDINKASNWAKPYIEKAEQYGLMNGDDEGNFRPKENITREEVAAVVVRLYEKSSKGV